VAVNERVCTLADEAITAFSQAPKPYREDLEETRDFRARRRCANR
jgi:hypothetical protein